MARIDRGVNVTDLLNEIEEMAKQENLSREQKSGIRKTIAVIVKVARRNIPITHIVYAEHDSNGNCSNCGNTPGNGAIWCGRCGALLDRALQRSCSEYGARMGLAYTRLLEKLDELDILEELKC